jgi:hypothetical protein
MEENNPRVLKVDVTLELKDYFHAQVDEVRIKLIIACLIVATVIAAFTYFFILIGEEKLLWQLSPLFFGFPIIAIVGQFLRFHASYRKHLRGLSESEKNIHYVFPRVGDGFDVLWGKNSSHIAWESVRAVVERPKYYRFVLGHPSSLVLPKRFFRHASDQKLMSEIISVNLEKKASF